MNTKRYRSHLHYKKIRARLWLLKGKHCAFCRMTARFEDQLTIDHMVPISRGGSREDFNLLLACETCNRVKGNELIVPLSALVLFDDNKQIARKVRYRNVPAAWLL